MADIAKRGTMVGRGHPDVIPVSVGMVAKP